MKLKDGVIIVGMSPQVVLAIMAAQDVYREYNTELVITSGFDGHHASNSKHYVGNAVDIRTHNLPNPKVDGQAIANRLDGDLGRDFDVLFEGDHIHIEYDPRRPL